MNHSWGGSQEEKNRQPRIILAIYLFWLKGEKKSALKENEKMIGIFFNVLVTKHAFNGYMCSS